MALETFGGTWGAGFVTAEPVDALGYASLAFAFRADAVEPTSVPRLLAGQFPAAFELAQNYPNPFNAETVIRYRLAARAAVHVSVYDLAGQRLLTLVDGKRPAGTHTITWDGRDEGGRVGVYLYHIEVEQGFSQMRKMLLLR